MVRKNLIRIAMCAPCNVKTLLNPTLNPSHSMHENPNWGRVGDCQRPHATLLELISHRHFLLPIQYLYRGGFLSGTSSSSPRPLDEELDRRADGPEGTMPLDGRCWFYKAAFGFRAWGR